MTTDIESLRAGLSAATDALNVSIAKAGAALCNLHLGVRASILLESGPDGVKWLAFAKYGKEWCLCLDFDGEVTPLRNASREDRLRAVPFFPALHEAMIKAVSEETERVEATCALAEAFITDLERP